MQIKLDKDETDILALIGDRDADLRAKVHEIARQGRILGRKIQRLERERVGLRSRLLSAVRRKRPDLTVPDSATPSMDGHGGAFLIWTDSAPDRKIPEKPATLDVVSAPPAPEPVAASPVVEAASAAPVAATNGACAHG